MKNNELISIVIPTYNQPEMLTQTLLSLNRQTDKHFEVIVSDDGSCEESRNAIQILDQQLTFTFTYLWQEDKGFRAAKARNQGIKKAKGEYIVFTDGDCILPPSFVKQHRKLARHHYFVDGYRILLSQPFTTDIHNGRASLHINFMSLLADCLMGKINKLSSYFTLPLGPLRLLQPTRWKGVKTANLAAWKQDLMAINGFNEAFEGWGHEDADLVIRLIRHGIKRKSGKYASVVFHQWHPTNDRSHEKMNKAALSHSLNAAPIRTHDGLEKSPPQTNNHTTDTTT